MLNRDLDNLISAGYATLLQPDPYTRFRYNSQNPGSTTLPEIWRLLAAIAKPDDPEKGEHGTCLTCRYWCGRDLPDLKYFGGSLGQCRGPHGSAAPHHQYSGETCDRWTAEGGGNAPRLDG